MYSGVGMTQVCREGQCHQCRGYEFTMSADYPWECDHYCHAEPPACLEDPESLDYFPPAEELRGDAIRHQSRED